MYLSCLGLLAQSSRQQTLARLPSCTRASTTEWIPLCPGDIPRAASPICCTHPQLDGCDRDRLTSPNALTAKAGRNRLGMNEASLGESPINTPFRVTKPWGTSRFESCASPVDQPAIFCKNVSLTAQQCTLPSSSHISAIASTPNRCCDDA